MHEEFFEDLLPIRKDFFKGDTKRYKLYRNFIDDILQLMKTHIEKSMTPGELMSCVDFLTCVITARNFSKYLFFDENIKYEVERRSKGYCEKTIQFANIYQKKRIADNLERLKKEEELI